MCTLAACNDLDLRGVDYEELQQAIAHVAATPEELAAMDAYVATLDQEQMESLVDGCYDEETDEGYIVLHAGPNPELLHEVVDEMFVILCA